MSFSKMSKSASQWLGNLIFRRILKHGPLNKDSRGGTRGSIPMRNEKKHILAK